MSVRLSVTLVYYVKTKTTEIIIKQLALDCIAYRDSSLRTPNMEHISLGILLIGGRYTGECHTNMQLYIINRTR